MEAESTRCTRRTAEYEEELSAVKEDMERKRQVLDAIGRMQPIIVLHRADISEDVRPERQDPERPHIKEEEEDKEISHFKEEDGQQSPYFKSEEEEPEDQERRRRRRKEG
ncbi:uncharacterized protein LOC144040749 isoform X3 [Vanacampus margaritifer]